MGGGAWPFLVGGAICLVNSDNERDSVLLTRRVPRRPWSRAMPPGVVRAAVTGEPVSPNAVGRRSQRVRLPMLFVVCVTFLVVRAADGLVAVRVAGDLQPPIGLPPADKA